MNEKQRLNHSQIIFHSIDQMKQERKAINEHIKQCDKDIEVNFLDDEVEFSEEAVKSLFAKKKKHESARSDVNAKIKKLWNDLEDCLYGKGEFDKDQLNFSFETEDAEEFFNSVKRAKLEYGEEKE